MGTDRLMALTIGLTALLPWVGGTGSKTMY